MLNRKANFKIEILLKCLLYAKIVPLRINRMVKQRNEIDENTNGDLSNFLGGQIKLGKKKQLA